MPIISKFRQLAVVLLLLACTPRALHATTVLHIDVDFLLNKAALIIEGEVISSEARWNTGKSHITTFITFQVNDTIKGDPGGTNITLGFAGGTVDDMTMQVSGMTYPAVGDKGIYFFEEPSQSLVNPLLGWGQGHFRIKSDSSGKQRVLTENNAPVMGLDDDTASSSTRTSTIPGEPLSRGVAKGVRAGKRNDARGSAMDKNEFKDSLKAKLAANQSSADSAHQTPGKKP